MKVSLIALTGECAEKSLNISTGRGREVSLT